LLRVCVCVCVRASVCLWCTRSDAVCRVHKMAWQRPTQRPASSGAPCTTTDTRHNQNANTPTHRTPARWSAAGRARGLLQPAAAGCPVGAAPAAAPPLLGAQAALT
jgi:hypothetical protein